MKYYSDSTCDRISEFEFEPQLYIHKKNNKIKSTQQLQQKQVPH